MTETGERCPDCGRPGCNAGRIKVYKSVERLTCYELTITRLRAELATLRQSSEHSAKLTEAERAVIDTAIAAGVKLGSEDYDDEDPGIELGCLVGAVEALLALRAKDKASG